MWEEGEHEEGFVHDDTSFNTIAQERHDIEEQILNISRGARSLRKPRKSENAHSLL